MSKKTRTAEHISVVLIQTALRVIVYGMVIVVLIVGVRVAYSFGYSLYNTESVDISPGIDKTFLVEEGMSNYECMKSLEENGLISDSVSALFQRFLYQYEVNPGVYTLNTSMTIKEILAVIDAGPDEILQDTQTDTGIQESDDEDIQPETREIIEE